MPHPFAALWRALDQAQRLDTALTRCFLPDSARGSVSGSSWPCWRCRLGTWR